MAFIRRIKKKDSVYLAEVENYREDGKVKQRVLRYLGKEVDGQPVRKVASSGIEVENVKQYLDYAVLKQISDRLRLPELLGERGKYILLLVFTQLIAHKPLYRLSQWSEETALKELLGLDKLVDKELFLALDALEELDFEEIETKLFDQLCVLGAHKERKALILDVTDTYFGGCDADWKIRKGKDGKVEKLIQVVLAVTKNEGLPILHKMYEGNISNHGIFKDTLALARLKKFGMIVMDRGMSSLEALQDLQALNQPIITGIRINNNLKTAFLAKVDREQIFQPAYQIKLKSVNLFVQSFEYHQGHLLVLYNPEIETSKRQKAMLDPDNYDPAAAKLLGYSLIYHNTAMTTAEVVRIYFEKDIVEKAFRDLKSSIKLQPVRKYRLSHVRAHVKICYLAYVLLAYMQTLLKPKGLSATYALSQLQSAYKVTLKSPAENLEWEKVVTLKAEQKLILKLLECSV